MSYSMSIQMKALYFPLVLLVFHYLLKHNLNFNNFVVVPYRGSKKITVILKFCFTLLHRVWVTMKQHSLMTKKELRVKNKALQALHQHALFPLQHWKTQVKQRMIHRAPISVPVKAQREIQALSLHQDLYHLLLYQHSITTFIKASSKCVCFHCFCICKTTVDCLIQLHLLP